MKGIDVDQFNTRRSETSRIRRKRKRGPGGEITLPITSTVKKIESGEYQISELLVPRQYKKIQYPMMAP